MKSKFRVQVSRPPPPALLTREGEGQGCVQGNGQPTSVCPQVSFDTGNPVPFVYATIRLWPRRFRIVGKPDLKGLRQACPSSRHNGAKTLTNKLRL
jgi:hypothetical protein